MRRSRRILRFRDAPEMAGVAERAVYGRVPRHRRRARSAHARVPDHVVLTESALGSAEVARDQRKVGRARNGTRHFQFFAPLSLNDSAGRDACQAARCASHRRAERALTYWPEHELAPPAASRCIPGLVVLAVLTLTLRACHMSARAASPDHDQHGERTSSARRSAVKVEQLRGGRPDRRRRQRSLYRRHTLHGLEREVGRGRDDGWIRPPTGDDRIGTSPRHPLDQATSPSEWKVGDNVDVSWNRARWAASIISGERANLYPAMPRLGDRPSDKERHASPINPPTRHKRNTNKWSPDSGASNHRPEQMFSVSSDQIGNIRHLAEQ